MSRVHGSKDFWVGALRTEGAALRAVLADAPPATPVLSCPGWTLTTLADHLAGIYGWVSGFAGAGSAEPPPARPDPSLHADPAEVTGRWQREFDKLVRVLDGLDPDAPAWNWAPQPKKAGFWPRRMAHETAVHRWDAQMAIAAGEPIEVKLACDGVSEVLDTWLPAGRRQAPEPRHGVVQLVATDAGQEWYVRLRGAGLALLDTGTLLDTDDHHPRVYATGTASDLLLALWGRIGLDVLEVSGETTLLESLRIG